MTEGAEVILNFHGVGDPTASPRAVEADEALYWIPAALFEEIAGCIAFARSRGRTVGITFDDGNASDLEICAPILARLGLRAEFFPLAGRIDAAGSLSAQDLRALRGMGMVLGSHGWDHVDWRMLDEEGRRREMEAAREVIARIAGAPATAAAIPFGRYDRRTLARLQAAGYARVYSSDGGPAGRGWLRPRASVRADMDLETAAALIEGRESSLRSWRRRAGMLKRRLL